MTGKARWTGFVCVRPRDGHFAKMTSRDLAMERPVRVRLATDPRLRGFRARRANAAPYGKEWASSDAELVTCRIRRGAVTCRHWRDHGFSLGIQQGGRRF